MSKYTIELRNVIKMYSKNTVKSWFTSYNLEDYLNSEQIETIENNGIWTKEKLAEKILNNYFMREIGFETPALFRHYAKIEMEKIMEEYLPLIYSANIQYDILSNVDYTDTYSRNINNSSSNNGLEINSDTPQGNINKSDILSGNYATNTTGNENSGQSTSIETSSRRIKGNSGVSATNQKMIMQFRDTIRAVDREIIDKLNILFMSIY